MVQNNLIAAPVGHVCEHLAAIGCVQAGEAYVHHFGLDVRQWPLAAIVVFVAVIYAAGLLTAKLVRRRFLKRRRPLFETPAFKDEAINPNTGLAVVVVGTVFVVGAIMLWRASYPRR